MPDEQPSGTWGEGVRDASFRSIAGTMSQVYKRDRSGGKGGPVSVEER